MHTVWQAMTFRVKKQVKNVKAGGWPSARGQRSRCLLIKEITRDMMAAKGASLTQQ